MARISLTPESRCALLRHHRHACDPAARLRCHILLLLDAGRPWALIAAVLFTSSATINRWRRAYLRGGIDSVLAGPHRYGVRRWWVGMVVRWVTALAPPDFGFARSRWTCEAVAIVLREDHRVRVSGETVRRRLREADLVWRRPRPVVRRRDPDRAAKFAALRELLHGLPADETAVFMGEVEVHTNPKVGCMWMRRGEQATVDTPGGQREARPSREPALADRATGRDLGSRGRGPVGRPVLPSPGRPAAGVPALPGHPRHLRQRLQSPTGEEQGGPEVPGGVV